MKYRTNVTIDKEAFEVFSSAGLNLSGMVNEMVLKEAKRIKAERWKEESRASMVEFTDYIEKHGSFADKNRSW